MTKGMSRRGLLAASGGVLVVAAFQPRAAAASHEDLIRRWYAAWEQPEWGPLDAMLTDDFTFSSAAGDDHITKSQFKKQCWETQHALIGGFVLEQLIATGDDAAVKYLCRTKQGKTFRNVELLHLRGDQLASIECYFGDVTGYPSAANKKA